MNFLQDMRFGFRMLAKDPAFTAVVVITLALCIGANTTVFTLVNAVLFRGLPFERADRLMALSSNNLGKNRNRMGVSYPDFADWRAHTRKFQGFAASTNQSMTLNDRGGVPENYTGARVDGQLLLPHRAETADRPRFFTRRGQAQRGPCRHTRLQHI